MVFMLHFYQSSILPLCLPVPLEVRLSDCNAAFCFIVSLFPSTTNLSNWYESTTWFHFLLHRCPFFRAEKAHFCGAYSIRMPCLPFRHVLVLWYLWTWRTGLTAIAWRRHELQKTRIIHSALDYSWVLYRSHMAVEGLSLINAMSVSLLSRTLSLKGEPGPLPPHWQVGPLGPLTGT